VRIRRPGTPTASRVVGTLPARASFRVLLDSWIAAFTIAALALSLAYVLFGEPPTHRGDQVAYRELGANFAGYWRGGYQGEVLRTPGYPAFLALIRAVTADETLVQIIQAFLLAASCLATAAIAAWTWGVAAGRVAALLFSLYLPLLSFASMVLTEALAISLATIGAAVAVHAAAVRARATWVAVAVVTLLVGVLVRPNTLVFMLPIAALLILAAPSARRRLYVVGITILAAVVLFGPWVGRNYALFERPMFLGDAGPFGLALGVHLPIDKTVGQFSSDERSSRFYLGQREDGFDPGDALALDAGRELRRNLRERPGEFLWSRVYLQYQMWLWPVTARTQYRYTEHVPYWSILTYHLVVLVAGFAGIVTSLRSAIGRLLGVLTLATAAPYLIFYPEPRYALPAMPFLMAAAGGFLVASAGRLRDAWRVLFPVA
jgi:hypothetical protein